MKIDRSNSAVCKVSFEEAEEEEVTYWAEKSIQERVGEATKWIEYVWKVHKRMHGEEPSLPDGVLIKNQVDEDDF